MRSLTCLALCALGAAFPAIAGDTEKPWLIPADKIYVSPEAKPLLNGVVLVRNGRIAAVAAVAAVANERSRIAVPEGTRRSECRGVVVAGFQNSHVHFLGGPFEGAATRPAAELERGLESMLTRYGFTTVFDTGSDQANTVALRSRIERGEVRGPRIRTAASPIYPADGIPSYLSDLPKHILQQHHQPKTVAEARANVRENLTSGEDGTKIFMVTSPARHVTKQLAPDIALAIAKETHARGKPLLAHPTSVAGIRAALDAGVDVIVHTTIDDDARWEEALTRRMVAQNMAVVPTLRLWEYELRKDQAPKEVVDRLLGAAFAQLRSFVAAGGQVLFGTDVGYMHEFDPTDEYVYMSKAGLTPMQILASLTTAPAARWQDKNLGRVEPGFGADLVVLAGDPADDVRNFARVRCVFRGGMQIYPTVGH
jgi:imidazolonepropionase-like amidohydrolase